MLINQTPWMAALEAQLMALGVIDKLLHYGSDSPLGRLQLGWKIDQRLLLQAAPFAWSKEATRAVLAASVSIPLDTEMSAWNLSSPAAFWHFDEPLPFQTVSTPTSGIKALGFGWMQLAGRRAFGMPCHTWIDDPDDVFPLMPSQTWEWEEGQTLGQMLDATRRHHIKTYGPGGIFAKEEQIGLDAFMVAAEGLSRFMLAGLAWLNQKIVTTEAGHIERHRRKEFQRTTDRVPEVRIIQLRKTEYPKGEGESANDENKVAWSCRWAVDGHWRNQPCGPKHGDRRLTYIAPFLKGPDDKPFRAPTKKVFVVNR